VADQEQDLQQVLDALYERRALWVHWLKHPHSSQGTLHGDLAQLQATIMAVEAVIQRGDEEPSDPFSAF